MSYSATTVGYSVIRNTSGSTQYFAFIGPHGATLTNGQDVAVAGDILTMHHKNKRLQDALDYALDNGLIEVLHNSACLVYDAGNSRVYQMGSVSGTATSVNMDYGSYSGSAPNP